ncbi:alpha-1,2-fucosyltransferase [Mucilaginibacter yixingensis]|uniref:alpha-1,2-fucosyltransferase n=1 Tax=Mucilaginibacter yixingensis TaxID=1295612 RepID=UPI001FE25F61|nr:alpha-1,2-fucosyltransferase [Mucilaginibacter yixingensis]
MSKNKKVYFDLSFLNKYNLTTTNFTARNYELSIFSNIKQRFANSIIIKLIKENHLIYRALKKYLLDIHIIYEEVNANELPSYHIVYMEGYFQDERYFKNIRIELLKKFKFPELSGDGRSFADRIKTTENAVSIHVRHGDYLHPITSAFHGVLSVQYYQEAIKIVSDQIAQPQYFVFSDDPDWCKTNLAFVKNSILVSEKNLQNWEEMYLMSLCKHNIIANSSFSWWGAWLNTNNDKIIVAPKNWFADQPSSIIPPEWIQV